MININIRVNVKLSHYLIKQHAMTPYGEVDV
jgi:hypothetical protein